MIENQENHISSHLSSLSEKVKTVPTTTSNVIDLTSQTEAEDETMENNDILFVNTKDIEIKEQEDKPLHNDEEHGTMDDNIDNYHFSRGGGMSSGMDR